MEGRRRSGSNEEHIKKAYAFLVERERGKATFSKVELGEASGWKASTVTTHISKKLKRWVRREGGAFRAAGIAGFSESEFVNVMSQVDDVHADPKKPRLKPEIESLLRKARQSALLALQIYNNPTTVFRTEGFSVMMVLAWTALLHAIFEKRGQSYLHLDGSGSPIVIDGDEKPWELRKCVDTFFGSATTPVRTNLDFFIRLRNKIEHRFVPEIDPTLSGECQALLFNFDELLSEEFGTYYAIRESLAMPLQTANIRCDQTIAAIRKLQARHFDELSAFIGDFRSSIPQEILGDQRYRFRVFLVPVPANHPSADKTIEYVKPTPENESQIAALTKGIVAIRERPVANAGHLKPSSIIRKVEAQLGKPFNMSNHTRAWQRYRVHQSLARGAKVTSEGCNAQFCVPDPVHNDYVYTAAWVEHLVKKLSDEKEYQALTSSRSSTVPA